jgi:dTDP-glucose pyrophosphorylase
LYKILKKKITAARKLADPEYSSDVEVEEKKEEVTKAIEKPKKKKKKARWAKKSKKAWNEQR